MQGPSQKRSTFFLENGPCITFSYLRACSFIHPDYLQQSKCHVQLEALAPEKSLLLNFSCSDQIEPVKGRPLLLFLAVFSRERFFDSDFLLVHFSDFFISSGHLQFFSFFFSATLLLPSSLIRADLEENRKEKDVTQCRFDVKSWPASIIAFCLEVTTQ